MYKTFALKDRSNHVNMLRNGKIHIPLSGKSMLGVIVLRAFMSALLRLQMPQCYSDALLRI